MLNNDEIEQINKKGISIDEFNRQIKCFETGFPELEITNAATIGDGIVKLTENESSECIEYWKSFLKSDNNGTVTMKFVPASGAASRMFKDLYEYKNSGVETDFIVKFFSNIKKFPFYSILTDMCLKKTAHTIEELYGEGNGQQAISLLLTEDGFNFGFYPKGLLPFHSYEKGSRTPAEEHLEESALYTKDNKNNVNIHFTVSSEHLSMFKNLIDSKSDAYKKSSEVNSLNVSFSVQSPSTDTVAVDLDNKPVKFDGKLLFRPGGHGALIQNLNDLDNNVDILFIKNIDNVVPDSHKAPVIKSTMELGGYFLKIRNKMWEYEKELKAGQKSESLLLEIKDFCEKKLFIKSIPALKGDELSKFLLAKLHRPLRICGMVKNEGEPGGGPYFCKNQDGTETLQILERSQISDNNPIHMNALQHSSHFNPVNLVCGLLDSDGKKFDLIKFVDQNAGFISTKSKNGITLKALERPGLWNGAMSDWNTIFVEMPAETFNPVKTVNDLLRPMHQQ